MHQHRTSETGPQTAAPVPLPGRRHRRVPWLALPVLAAALTGVAFLPACSAGLPPAETPPSAVAAPSPAAVALSPAASPDPSLTVAPGPAASPPTGLVFPAAGMDMVVLELTPSEADLASQTLVPPLTTDAYWLTPYGMPGSGSDNTTYIVGHSWDGKDAPFNRLSDTSLPGSEFTLSTETGTHTYVVDSVITHDKDSLKDSEIWNIVPNRVVLISCYTEDPWGKNVVVTAVPKVTP